MNWWKSLKGRIKFNEPLKSHTSFKIGGPAKFFVEPADFDDLKSLLRIVKTRKLNLFVLGSGSNVLISDKGINGVVLHFGQPFFKKVSFTNNRLKAGCGVALSRLISLSSQKGLSGLEFLAGIPGSVGGALAMNAGISEYLKRSKRKVRSISDSLENVTLMDYNGKIKTLGRKEANFGYRQSGLQKYIVLAAEFKLAKKDKSKIQEQINKYRQCRKTSQDLGWPSAGCVFKNPKKHSAGKLIDECGLKGKRIKDIRVSSKHANFILNTGCGRSGDVLKLMALMQKRVRVKYKIGLEPEIKIWQ